MSPEQIARMQAARKAAREAGVVGVRTNPIEKAKADPTSRSKAINAMCYDCQGRDGDPHYQWRIGNCPSKECPLYPLRPYRGKLGQPLPVSLGGTGTSEDTDEEDVD